VAVVGLLVAAGSGERLGAGLPKAFVDCGGRPLLEWSLDALRATCDRVVLAVPAGLEREDLDPAAARAASPGLRGDDVDRVAGAATRSVSVRAALSAAPAATTVVVHDAARPLLTASLVERCLAALEEGWDGAVAAARATDTLKEVGPEDGAVLRTLDRRVVWAAQTPQVFRAEVLRRALAVDEATLSAASDDASLVEAAGGAVRVVEAPPDNLKVTSSLDLRIAESRLFERSGRGGASSSGPPPRDRSLA
jgi:2-C-methyl-D-erythritol 4-phosphate cytidylyltransferase